MACASKMLLSSLPDQSLPDKMGICSSATAVANTCYCPNIANNWQSTVCLHLVCDYGNDEDSVLGSYYISPIFGASTGRCEQLVSRLPLQEQSAHASRIDETPKESTWQVITRRGGKHPAHLSDGS